MHLPDAMLSVPVCGAAWAASAGAVGAAVRQAGRERGAEAGPRTMLLAGVLAAFVFVAQMFNFPISGGTTGHLLGAALVTALVGPWVAVLVMCVVFVIQAFVFADGGVVALGANLFNMGIVGCLASALILPAVARLKPGAPSMRTAALALAAWVSVMLGALMTSLELAASGTVPASTVLPAMLGVHAVIGLGEAVISVAAYQIIVGVRGLPEGGFESGHAPGAEPWRLAVVLALGLACVRLAFPHPDGLEYVAGRLGFEPGEDAAAAYQAAPLPDYTIPGREAQGFDYAGSYASAALGGLLSAGLMYGIGAVRRRPAAPEPV